MKKDFYKYSLTSIIIAVLLAILFSHLNYVENEGFNPTDEGVVLAHSWRIINGETPHQDFVSIRPAASGYLHTINYILPGSLVVNARWFVLFQFFVIALVMSFLVFKNLSSKYQNPKLILLISLLISGFTLTVLNYNLYSWTTIDAIFWSVLALPLILNCKNKYLQALGLAFLSLAALSRQTFVLVALAGFLHIIYEHKRNFIKLIPALLVGALPFIAYFLMLLSKSAIGDFFQQMTGRTEFFQTAILQFAKRFVFAISTPLNILCVFVTILLYSKRKTGLKELFIDKGFHSIFALIFIVFGLALTIKYFFAGEIDIHTLPFELFFMLISLGIMHWLIVPLNKKLRQIGLFAVFISWVSAISLGDNTPVFATGILFITLVAFASDIIMSKVSKYTKPLSNQWLVLAISIVIFVSGYLSQQKFNYRDNSSDKLVLGLNYSSSEFGNIKTNPALIAYYSDLKDNFEAIPDAIDNTIVFPHNAMFYPVMKTRNPMSLDWLIANEYIGQEERIKTELENLKTYPNTYFIVDNIDLRIIRYGITPRLYKDDIVYEFIINNCELVNSDSDFFMVYNLK